MPRVADTLRVEIETKECQIPDDERMRIEPVLDKVRESVRELPSAQLWLTVVFHSRSDVYHAQAKMRIPGHTIITGHQDPMLDTALMRCLDKVLHRLEISKSQPDHEALQRAERQVDLHTNIIAPVDPDAGKVGAAIQNADYPAFRNALLGYEEWIRMRIGRWIQRYPDLEPQIGRTMEISDLVEEVFLMAFEEYSTRPKQVAISDWLESLLDPAIKSFWHNPEDRESVRYAQTLTGRRA